METHLLALPAGYRIESYEIQAVLGKGGFGITYRALDLQLDKQVAIKELLIDTIATRVEGSTVVPQRASLQEDWDWARESFRKEAKILARFSHPAIVGVHRIIEANGTGYMVMDYVEGETYEAKLRRIGREPDQASLMAVVGPLLDGLSEVHASGLLHRDIKPENILINRRGQPVLIDFGTARSTVAATMTMTMMGTAGYMPIEQSQTKGNKGPWTDIYAIGVMMCRAITGEKPPCATDRIMEDEFQWLSYRQIPGYSEQFLQTVDWALRVRPEERPQSIADWMPHLISSGNSTPEGNQTIPVVEPEEEVPDDEPAQPEPVIVDPPPPPTKQKSQPFLLAVATILILWLLFPIVVNIIQRSDSEKQAQSARIEAEKTTQEQQRLAGEEAKAEAARKAEEQQRLERQAEATRAETARAEAAKKAEEQARLEREAEAAKVESEKKAAEKSLFENSLGMKFVPIPGTDVLFSIWDTRVKDYAVYVQESGYAGDTQWKKPGFQQTPNDPVVNVTWEEAKAFCMWLTVKEQGEGKIAASQFYRLPTDAEWSAAVGLPSEIGDIPGEKDGKVKGVYPWGTQWPPPKGAGNYHPSLGVDSYEKTSSVGSFPANRFGLYDMGGNVWQWCEDWYSGGRNGRVLRGGSCGTVGVLSSYRHCDVPGARDNNYGFRCVLGYSR